MRARGLEWRSMPDIEAHGLKLRSTIDLSIHLSIYPFKMPYDALGSADETLGSMCCLHAPKHTDAAAHTLLRFFNVLTRIRTYSECKSEATEITIHYEQRTQRF